jgi:hypothetical protein
MTTKSLEEMLLYLDRHKNGIFVWVPVGNNTHQSIRVEYSAALIWCHTLAKKTNDIPCFIGEDEIFLGVPPKPEQG